MSYCAVYLNRIYRERNFPEKPEDPLILEKDIPFDGDFTFVDFVPSVLAYSSQEVEYHRFSHLIETANSWLRRNSHWKLVNCETVKLSYRHNLTNMVSRWEQQINPTTTGVWSPQIRGGEYETSLKVFRLWIRRKDIDEDDFDTLMSERGKCTITLKYIDFIPQRINGNVFETIDDLLIRVNERISRSDANKWNMIALESLKVEANSDWNALDTELSLAEESSRHLIVLRLYYEEYNYANNNDFWPSSCQTITVGIEDFKPRHLSGGSFFKRPQFETFSSLVQRAAKWLTNQSSVQFLNAKSIDIKIKSLTKIDSRSCTHIEHGDYIQLLRVVYFRYITASSSSTQTTTTSAAIMRPRSAQSRSDTSADASMRLGSKVILVTKFEHPLDSVQQRIHSWLRSEINQDVCVLSAETVDIYGKDDDERNLERALEECFQSNRLGSLNMYAFTAVRLFYCIVPKYEKNEKLKSSLSLSASTCRPTSSLTQKFSRQESLLVTKRKRWGKQMSVDYSSAISHRKSSPQSSPKVQDNTAEIAVNANEQEQVGNTPFTRRPTAQYDNAQAIDYKVKQIRPRSNSTSCNCM